MGVASDRISECLRRGSAVAVALCVLLVVAAPSSAAVGTRLHASGDAAAFITFDLDSGEVVAAQHEHTPMLVASTFKVVTALVVRANVDLTASVPVSERATEVPALKLDLGVGERWNANALLHAMLIASLNDAAYALAEAAGGGSLDGFTEALEAHGRRLGFADSPVMRDPAGLDDEFSNDGGNRISARDLAIATRAFMADPLLASIVSMPSYEFEGGDGAPHRVVSHNGFLQTYPQATGVKTGYTERSGSSLIASATRGDRSFAVVVIGADDPAEVATRQLDAAFASVDDGHPSDAGVDRLPAIGIAQTSLDARSAPTARAAVLHTRLPVERTSWIPIVGGLIVVAGAVILFTGRVGGRGRPADPPRRSRAAD